MQLTKEAAMQALANANNPYVTLFAHGTMRIEWYQPVNEDLQTPHAQDELYVIAAGRGTFYNDGTRTTFSSGDVLFVKAGNEHRFENFTPDFATWVIFYGPDGGE